MSTKGKIEPHHVRDVIGSISADSLVDLCVSIFQDTPQRLHNLMVLSNQLNDEGVEPVHLVRELLAIHRDLLVFQLSQDTNSLKQGKVPFASLIDLSSIESLSQLVSIPEIHHRLLILEAAALSVQQSSNPLIGLEICLLQLAYPCLGKE
jgi:DNA polymerase III gamma/tau subunit